MHRVLIVDDSRTARGILETCVNRSEEYMLVRSLESAENAVVYCMSGGIDLVLMDVYTKNGENGLEASAKIKSMYPNIKIIVVTSMPEESFIRRAKKAGCDSFWYKDVGEEEILDVMNRTMNGESVYPLDTPVVEIGYAKSYEFTQKELEILRDLVDGIAIKEIAIKRDLSERTVKYHITNMLQKTGYKTSMQLVVDVVNQKLIVPEF